MKFGKKSIGAITAGLSLVMALAPVTPAFAENTGTQADTTKGVTKVLQVNAGSSVTAQFQYTATPTVLNADNAAQATENHNVSATIGNIDLTANGQEATGTAAITYGTFPHAGTYAWVVSEKTGTYTGAGDMQYDPQTYTLVAVVNNGANGPEVAESYLIKGTATTTSGDKVGTATFTNKYTESANGEDTDLTITKEVAGDQGDKTKPFSFTVTFTAPDVLPAGVTADDYLAGITCDKGTNSAGTVTFTLKDGETATFGKIIAGTKYTVAETDEAGYTKSYSAVNNGVEASTTENNLIGENANTGTMTNTKESTVVTGVIMNNAPFVVTLAVAAAGVVAYGSAKRKLEK